MNDVVRRFNGRSIVVGFAIVALLIWIFYTMREAPLPALHALWFGSVGSSYALISGTLVRAVPLMLGGLGIAVAFRAGVFNIGAEGQLLAGATVTVALGSHLGGIPAPVAIGVLLVTGTMAGAAWAGIAAWLRTYFGVLEVISTIMLNFIAQNLVSYLVRGPLQEPLHIYPQTETLPARLHLGMLIPGTRLHWGLLIALVLAMGTWWAVTYTAAGFRLRLVGANPAAAFVSGRIVVGRVSAGALLISGALAGLAGAVQVLGVTFALYENLAAGFGFSAIAVGVLAGLHPIGVLGSGFLFAALETGATAMQRDAGVPSVWASVIEAILILVIVGASSTRWRQLRRSVTPEIS